MSNFPKRGCLFDTETGLILSAWEIVEPGDYDQHLEFIVKPDGTRRPIFDPTRHQMLDLDEALEDNEIYDLYRDMEKARVRRDPTDGSWHFKKVWMINGTEQELDHPLEAVRAARKETS